MATLSVEFVTPFKDKYQRNNKQTGKKNLRCFPCCHPVKHMTTGFCGQPVKVVIKSCPFPASRLRCWAVFETVGAEEKVKEGDQVKETDITKKERTRQCPMNEYMRGNVYAGIVDFDANGFEIMTGGYQPRENQEGCVTVVINSERMGYHYGWSSNKHTCDSFHVMKLYVFSVVNSDGWMRCIGSYTSPPFQIFCRRRTKKTSEDADPVSLQTNNVLIPEVPEEHLQQPQPPPHSYKRQASLTFEDERTKKMPRFGSTRRRTSEGGIQQQVLLRLMEFICFKDASARSLEGGGSSSAMADFSSNILGGLVYGIDFDQTIQDGTSTQPEPEKPQSLGSKFAAHLLEEKSFTEMIGAFFRENAFVHQDERSLSALFTQFISIVKDHVQGFVEKYNISLEEFQRQLNEESTAVNTSHEFKIDLLGVDPKKRFNSFKIAFLRRLKDESSPAALPVNSAPIAPQFDISGCWVNTGENLDEFDRAHMNLAARGYPVFVFKIIRHMLWRFRVTMSGDYLAIQGEKKLMHSGTFVFKIDNNDHPFEIPHVIPLGMASIPCMYRATCEVQDGVPLVRCTIHGFFPRLHGVRFEATRTVFILDNHQSLDMHASFLLIRATGHKECLASFKQHFVKTSNDDDARELIDFTNDILELDF